MFAGKRANADWLAKADWLDATRLRVYPRIFLAVYAVLIAWLILVSPHLIDRDGKPVGTDFISFWSAGKLALNGDAATAYDYVRHYEVERQALPWAADQQPPYFAFAYPPLFLMIAAMLALLPYGLSLALWLGATLLAYLATIRSILPDRRALAPALAFPAVFVELGHGQNAFLTCALLGGGLLLLQRRPIAAGILFGLLAIKPQLGLLLPLALIVGRQWRAIMATAVTLVATIAVSLLLFGRESWIAFFNGAGMARRLFLEQGDVGWEKFQSVFAGLRLIGAGIGFAYMVQAVVLAAVAAAVIWAWRRPVDPGLKYAVLVVTSLMATPFVLDYDLVLLALPIAWLALAGLERGFLDWEKTVLAAAWLLPFLSRLIAQWTAVSIAPAVLAVFLLLLLRRIGRESGAA